MVCYGLFYKDEIVKYFLLAIMLISLNSCAFLLPDSIKNAGHARIEFERDEKGIKKFFYDSGKEYDSMSVSISRDALGNITDFTIKVDGVKAFDGQRIAEEASLKSLSEFKNIISKLGLNGLLLKLFTPDIP